jgi:hypothetical protein
MIFVAGLRVVSMNQSSKCLEICFCVSDTTYIRTVPVQYNYCYCKIGGMRFFDTGVLVCMLIVA